MGKSGCEGREDDVVALLEQLLVVPHGQRNRCCRRVAVAVDVDDDLFERYLRALGHGLDDAAVGLVGYHPVDGIGSQSESAHHHPNVVAHLRDGIAEDRAPLLIDIVELVRHREL